MQILFGILENISGLLHHFCATQIWLKMRSSTEEGSSKSRGEDQGLWRLRKAFVGRRGHLKLVMAVEPSEYAASEVEGLIGGKSPQNVNTADAQVTSPPAYPLTGSAQMLIFRNGGQALTGTSLHGSAIRLVRSSRGMGCKGHHISARPSNLPNTSTHNPAALSSPKQPCRMEDSLWRRLGWEYLPPPLPGTFQ